MIITVTPNPSLDLTYLLADGDEAGHLSDPAVEVHRARSASLEASGKGVNVSRALAQAGKASIAILFAGGGTGHQLLELLTIEQVSYRTVVQAGATRVNTTVLRPGGATAKVNAPGTAVSADEVDNLVMAVQGELVTIGSDSGSSWLLICGSLPPSSAANRLIERLVASAHARGSRVAVDSSGAGLAAGLAAGADLLAPNAAELNAIRPWSTALGPAAVLGAAVGLAAERGCELLVSLGAEGALWTDGRRALRARGPAIVPVNTAGAGDALLAGWFSTDPEADAALRLATAVAWGTAACLVSTTVAVGGIPPAVDAVLVSESVVDRPPDP